VLGGVGRGVRGYLDGWAIDVEHGFGQVERAKIALAFGLRIMALGLGSIGAVGGRRCDRGRGGEVGGCTGVDRSEVAADRR
jgi:hypothetical protein